MWIMSQDGAVLIQPRLIRTVQHQMYAVTESGQDEDFLGEYESEERAKEVLNEIACCIGKGVMVLRMLVK